MQGGSQPSNLTGFQMKPIGLNLPAFKPLSQTGAAPGAGMPPLPQPAMGGLKAPSLNMPSIGFQPMQFGVGAPGGTLLNRKFEKVKPPTTEDAELKNLKDIRKNSGLKEVPVGKALDAFRAAAGEGNGLTKSVFMNVYAKLMSDNGIPSPTPTIQASVFRLFDKDNNGIVDMLELSCGVSMLCKGTEDEKIMAVFKMFDADGSGFISMDEMFKFLTSVFKVVLTPNVLATMRSMGVEVESAEDLASVTSLECFKTADLNGDGKLSVDEFRSWFYAPKNDPGFMFSPMRKLLH